MNWDVLAEHSQCWMKHNGCMVSSKQGKGFLHPDFSWRRDITYDFPTEDNAYTALINCLILSNVLTKPQILEASQGWYVSTADTPITDGTVPFNSWYLHYDGHWRGSTIHEGKYMGYYKYYDEAENMLKKVMAIHSKQSLSISRIKDLLNVCP